jgi:hypothetical protein
VISGAPARDHHSTRLIARLDVGSRLKSPAVRAAHFDRLVPIVLCFAFAIAIALSLSASPRRSGDAHQYIAMALQLSQLRPPSLSPGEEAAYRSWLEDQGSETGFPDGALAVRQPALIHDGRQEFSHFWFYSLLAAPATAVAAAIGAHPIAAFSVTNASLLGAALLATFRALGPLPALAILASPLVWFIARAQVEVFTVALLCLAMAALARGGWGWAALAVATASTQNAPIAAAIPIIWAAATTEWVIDRRSRQCSLLPDRALAARAVAFAVATVAVALLHPAYYLHRLGVFTPQELNGGIAGAWPTAGKYLAPLIDPDIGLMFWMPVTVIVALFGLGLLIKTVRIAGTEDRHLALTALMAVMLGLWFLFVFAQTTNINSGGTVHVSRYALWLIPLMLPPIAAAGRFLAARAPGILLVAAITIIAAYFAYFQPDQPERYVEHSPQAAWLMSHAADAYRPLPEIFVERTLHIDGGPRASAADPSCRVVLVVAMLAAQPCPLNGLEQAEIDARFAAGDAAVWLRRGANGSSSVTTALAGS